MVGNNVGVAVAAVADFVAREEILNFISPMEMAARIKRARALAMGSAVE